MLRQALHCSLARCLGKIVDRANIRQPESVATGAIENQPVFWIDIHWNPGEYIAGCEQRCIYRCRRGIKRKPAELRMPRMCGRVRHPDREHRIVSRYPRRELWL